MERIRPKEADIFGAIGSEWIKVLFGGERDIWM